MGRNVVFDVGAVAASRPRAHGLLAGGGESSAVLRCLLRWRRPFSWSFDVGWRRSFARRLLRPLLVSLPLPSLAMSTDARAVLARAGSLSAGVSVAVAVVVVVVVVRRQPIGSIVRQRRRTRPTQAQRRGKPEINTGPASAAGYHD